MQDWMKIFHFNRALLRGHFKLSSGLHSPVYIQCARILMYPWYAEELGQALSQKIRAHALPEMIVSPALGGMIIGHETARALSLPFLFTERYGGNMMLRRGFEIAKDTAVWIVEDVVTTGKSSLETAEVIRQYGGQVIGFAALVDRRTNGGTFPAPFVSLLEIPAPVYKPNACPLCKEKIPITTPGSRFSSGSAAPPQPPSADA